jgi:hypothetical protein
MIRRRASGAMRDGLLALVPLAGIANRFAALIAKNRISPT